MLDLQIRAGQGTSLKTFELFKPLRSPDLASLNTYRHVRSCVGPETRNQEPGLCAMAETEHVTLSFTFFCQRED